MAAEETTEATEEVTMTRDQYAQLAQAMQTYKQIELAYLKLRATHMRRVLITLTIANLLLFGGLVLAEVDWQMALSWTVIAFAAEEAFLALGTFVAGLFRRA